MNVNITGIYDNTVIVDNNSFEDVRLLHTWLSSLSNTLFSVVEGLPNQYANLTSFSNLYPSFDDYTINDNSNISTINLDIVILSTSLCILSSDYPFLLHLLPHGARTCRHLLIYASLTIIRFLYAHTPSS